MKVTYMVQDESKTLIPHSDVICQVTNLRYTFLRHFHFSLSWENVNSSELPLACHIRIQQPHCISRIKMAHLHSVHTIFSSTVPTVLIPVSALLSIAFGIWLWYRVSAIKVGNGHHGLRTENGREYLLEEEQRGEDEVCLACDYQMQPADLILGQGMRI